MWLVNFLQAMRVLQARENTFSQEPEDESSFEPQTRMPQKKGIFVQTVKLATKEGTPQALASFAKSLNLSWVTIIFLWQHSDRDRFYQQVDEAADACQNAGIKVWLWGWPEAASHRIDTFVEHAQKMLEVTTAEGLILNAEKPFYGKKFSASAQELMKKLRSQTDKPIGLSSYGQTSFHPSFPWEAFAQCDFGMPQIYDSKHTLGPQYPQNAVDSWKKSGFSNLVPTWGASKAHTPQQMKDIISRTPAAPAVCWWDCNHIRSAPARADVVRKMAWFDGEA